MEYIAHHGIKGQKWGIRRFQNPDGTLTSSGRERYSGNTKRNKLTTDQKAAIATTVLSSLTIAASGYAIYKMAKDEPISDYSSYSRNTERLVSQMASQLDSMIDAAVKSRTEPIGATKFTVPTEDGIPIDQLYSQKSWQNSYFDGWTDANGGMHGKTKYLH